MQYLNNNIKIYRKYNNVATLLKSVCDSYSYNNVFCFKESNNYQNIQYAALFKDVCSVAKYLKSIGFKKGEKMVIFSPNCYEMLVVELAVMSIGGVAVPIFAYFKKETASLLINHCDANYLTIYGEFQYLQLENIPKINKIFILDKNFHPRGKTFQIPCINFNSIPIESNTSDSDLNFEVDENEICLNMYTSGTMGIPKCVQLTHKNIFSQQDALSLIWNVDSTDRFLSYLPWHHSFGGIFELFTVLYNGASYWLEPSYGKDINSIIDNWRTVKPTIFFSVPKVHKSLVEHIVSDSSFEKNLFHSEFKFIFTAAAPLPENVAKEYLKRNIRIFEGWGLTETSPCCTISEFKMNKEIGIVGFPIPGVQIRIDDEGEIQVKGYNVMVGYYNNEEANKESFTEDGWFKTGDLGEITSEGLKLIARKDRVFKLSNGEKVIPSDIEKLLEKKCCYVAYSVVYGGGKEYPVALIFPNKKFFDYPPYDKSPDEGCFCPRNFKELGKCLSGCLNDVNNEIHQKFSKLKLAAIINDELKIDDNTLTPSLKPSPKNIIKKYLNLINEIYNHQIPFDKDVYLIILDNQLKNAMYGGN
ncbi:MAG: AMP-binding protein [Bacteroidia bacterium]